MNHKKHIVSKPRKIMHESSSKQKPEILIWKAKIIGKEEMHKMLSCKIKKHLFYTIDPWQIKVQWLDMSLILY